MPAEANTPQETQWHGMGVAPGLAIARIYVFNPLEPSIPKRRIMARELKDEAQRLERALLATRSQLLEVRGKMDEAMATEGAAVFEAHLLAVDDPAFMQEILKKIFDGRICAEQAVAEVSEHYAAMFEKMEDDYLRERAVDIRDVSMRILRNLAGKEENDILLPSTPHILAAKDISPSDMVSLPKEQVRGILLAGGSPTSHSTILIRAMGIPAVIHLDNAWPHLHNGTRCILDGVRGRLVLNPTARNIQKYRKIQSARVSIRKRLNELKSLPPETPDGVRMTLGANIEMPSDVKEAKEHGADSIGLFRTEYLYLSTDRTPEEETQYRAYAAVAQAMTPAQTILRTLDLGGDKLISTMRTHQESNPFLGWRAIRLCLAEPDMFKSQLRAILRAGAFNPNLCLMYPMISCLQEVMDANAILEECKQELTRENTPFNENIRVGIMVEIPSAAISAHLLAPHVDFFSIGTNDLTQYTLAVDRDNEHVAHLYDPLHPAILRLIHTTVTAGNAHRIPTAICGEIAGNAILTPLLIGLGVRELSMAPVMLPLVKAVIRNVPAAVCRDLAEKALTMESAEKIMAACKKIIAQTIPDILELVD